MIPGVQPKVSVKMDENGNLTLDDDMMNLLYKEEELNWRLVRERDNLTKQSRDIIWIEWDENGMFKEDHKNIAVGRSLLMSPFGPSFTWQTTEVEEILENREDFIKFRTRNSNYSLYKLK